MTDTQNMLKDLKIFFLSKYSVIINNECEPEYRLLENLNIESALQLQKDQGSEQGLFGKGLIESDYRSNDNNTILIEFKKIGLKTSNGTPYKNEHDIKNALAQIIEQAYCQSVCTAILAIIDGGQASEREWNEREKAYVNMFKNNSLGINLTVLRIRVVTSSQNIYFEVI